MMDERDTPEMPLVIPTPAPRRAEAPQVLPDPLALLRRARHHLNHGGSDADLELLLRDIDRGIALIADRRRAA